MKYKVVERSKTCIEVVEDSRYRPVMLRVKDYGPPVGWSVGLSTCFSASIEDSRNLADAYQEALTIALLRKSDELPKNAT